MRYYRRVHGRWRPVELRSVEELARLSQMRVHASVLQSASEAVREAMRDGAITDLVDVFLDLFEKPGGTTSRTSVGTVLSNLVGTRIIGRIRRVLLQSPDADVRMEAAISSLLIIALTSPRLY
jgi:hypothetical protein